MIGTAGQPKLRRFVARRVDAGIGHTQTFFVNAEDAKSAAQELERSGIIGITIEPVYKHYGRIASRVAAVVLAATVLSVTVLYAMHKLSPAQPDPGPLPIPQTIPGVAVGGSETTPTSTSTTPTTSAFINRDTGSQAERFRRDPADGDARGNQDGGLLSTEELLNLVTGGRKAGAQTGEDLPQPDARNPDSSPLSADSDPLGEPEKKQGQPKIDLFEGLP